MAGLRKLADVHDEASLSNRMRSRRFEMFKRLVAPLPRPVRIIDVGGTNLFWEQRGEADSGDWRITLVNLEAEEKAHEFIDSVVGDATSLEQFGDKSFDVAFSNSVIEHLFTYENQKKMAEAVRRVAGAYWVQTPNYWFPMEPHFHVPGWQWMPKGARVALIRRRRCGWRGPCPELEDARALVNEVRLMTRGELARAFPGATIWREKLYGLTKSFVVFDGFPGSVAGVAAEAA